MTLEDMAALVEEVEHAPLEMRSAEVMEVRHPDRIITLLAAPYEVETPVLRAGRWITETFASGAFRGVEQRAGRVKVNRDHDLTRTCGRAVALHPSRAEGLLADLRISRTDLGDETLELTADHVLGASVGFAPMRSGGESWTEDRSRRRVEHAYLGHIALVPDPAYEGTEALDVRSASAVLGTMLGNTAALAEPAGTPRKDAVLAALRELGYPRSPK